MQALLHAVIAVGLIGLIGKLHKWDDSAIFFDGSSLGTSRPSLPLPRYRCSICIHVHPILALSSFLRPAAACPSLSTRLPLPVQCIPICRSLVCSRLPPAAYVFCVAVYLTVGIPSCRTVVSPIPDVDTRTDQIEALRVLSAGNTIIIALMGGIIALQVSGPSSLPAPIAPRSFPSVRTPPRAPRFVSSAAGPSASPPATRLVPVCPLTDLLPTCGPSAPAAGLRCAPAHCNLFPRLLSIAHTRRARMQIAPTRRRRCVRAQAGEQYSRRLEDKMLEDAAAAEDKQKAAASEEKKAAPAESKKDQ